MVTLEEALEMLLGRTAPLDTEEVALAEAHGRVSAGDIRAPVDLPAFDRSAMDGYAVRSLDTNGAREEAQVHLALRGGLGAGESLRPGEAARVATGGPLPPGADAVLVVEAAREDGEAVWARAAVRPGDNVIRRGSDVSRGTVVLQRGTELDAVALGLLAGLGVTRIRVFRRPRVHLVVTGDEVVAPHEEPGPGQIRDQNSLGIGWACREAGAEVVGSARVGDDPDRLREALTAAGGAEVVLVSGGVSVGRRDFLRRVVAEMGGEELFWRVRMRPGKSAMGALVDGRPLVGLAGSPGSAMLTFQLLVRPLLRHLGGHRYLARPRVPVRLADGFPKASPRPRYLRATVGEGAAGRMAHLIPGQGSDSTFSWLRANALVVVPGGSGPLAPGESLEAIMLDRPEEH